MKKKKSRSDQDAYYKYFKYEYKTYVLDLETDELFRIGKESFKPMEDKVFRSDILNFGTVIDDITALDKSDFNYIPAHIEQWLEKEQEHEDLKFFRYEGFYYVHDRKEYGLFKICTSCFQRVENPYFCTYVLSDGSVISEDKALAHSTFDSFPHKNFSQFIIEDPNPLKKQNSEYGKDLKYYTYKSSCYISKEDHPTVLEVLPRSFLYIRDEALKSEVKELGTPVSKSRVFEQSTLDSVPEYLMRSLFDEENIYTDRTEYKEKIQWPADHFPHLKTYFLCDSESEITFYYSVEEDEYETTMGDGLYYHFDRAFLSEKNMRRYVELSKSRIMVNYEARELKISMEDNQYVFQNPSSRIEEYYPEYILQGLDEICSDPYHPDKVQDLLKVYCILSRRNRCEALINSFSNNLYMIRNNTLKMKPENPQYYQLVKIWSNYNDNNSYIHENTVYPAGTFDNCIIYHDLKQFHFPEKLRNIISVFEYVFHSITQIDYTNPPFHQCVESLKEIIEELKDHLIDLDRMSDGDFKSFL